MKITSKLYVLVGLLLAIAVGSAALSLFSAREGASHVLRSNLAHQVYQSYLSLSNHTYQLFKQFGDAMLIGDRDHGAGEAELLAMIEADIADIRRATAEEITLVGAEEVEELEHLEQIETMIEDLLVEYEEIIQTRNDDEFSTYWLRLSRMLDETIDKDFNQLIQEAITEEAEEVREEMSEANTLTARFRVLAAVLAILALASAVASVWVLQRGLRDPIVRLVEGASALERGNLEHRIEVAGRSELDFVALAFNSMAQEIAFRQRSLSDTNDRLERAVSERTTELERLLEALRKSDGKRRQLLADVSHELRTPLTIIRGEADIALRNKEYSVEHYRDVLGKIRDAVLHTANLVDDLLFVARHEAGETRLKLEMLDLSALLSSVVDQHDAIARQHGAAVGFSSMVQTGRVRADAGRVRQVALILLENAVRYGGGSIQVTLAPMPDGYIVSVTNDGPGMSPAEEEQAFDRFFRGSNAATRYEDGAGLGLPMARAIIEAHGGEIWLKCGSSDGVTVSFTLPLRGGLEAVA